MTSFQLDLDEKILLEAARLHIAFRSAITMAYAVL